MISEKQFASGFPCFWTERLPFLTPQVVTEMNIRRRVLKDAEGEPLEPFSRRGDNSQNDFIAEAAFELFVVAVRQNVTVLSLAKDRNLLTEVANNSIARLLGLREYWRSIGQRFPKTTSEESVALATRIEDYFAKEAGPEKIFIQPRFKGCGILDSCYGDVLVGTSLYELKIVDRSLRSTDLRQLLIYAALNQRSQQYRINTVVVVNPRRGTEYKFAVEPLIQRISGHTPTELFHRITEFLIDFDAMHKAS